MHSNDWRMDRRTLFKAGIGAAAGAALGRAEAASRAPESGPSLREKFFGCIAGCHIGSAMGAAVEGWSWERIQETHGTLDRLLPYEHYGNGWRREPGTTEDGVERQKHMITAILEKQDRVCAEDVRRIWARDIRPDAPGNVSEPFEGMLLAMAKTSLPAADIGKYCDYAGLVSMARSCHPLGLINAGDVAGAINDVREVGQLYQIANSRGIRWAEVTAAGIAAAAAPGATVDRVLEALATHCDKAVWREIERGLGLAAECRDFRDLRAKFADFYSGRGMASQTEAIRAVGVSRSHGLEAIRQLVAAGLLRDTGNVAARSPIYADCGSEVSGVSGEVSGADR